MQLKHGTTERTGASCKIIKQYMRAGLLGKKSSLRFDNTDYYMLKKPTTFISHKLDITQYIGCYVSPGIGLTVKVNGEMQNLEQFAISCSYR
ncbi:hypothetical protein CSQ92_07370 [Janthinobacterium sp. BJB446]|nr:hypothetical protein CSQ92_07370 [Janthinobacterium sp. BJB446]